MDGLTEEGAALTRLNSYKLVYKTIAASQAFSTAAEQFKTTGAQDADIRTLRTAYSEFTYSWKLMVGSGPLPVSQTLADRLNALRKPAEAAMNGAEGVFREKEQERMAGVRADQERQRQAAQEAEQERTAGVRAEQERQRQAAQEAEQQRLAQWTAEQQAEADQRKAEEEAAQKEVEAKIESLDRSAKAVGFKGLNKSFGVARFLLDCQRGGSLESGLNQVFWIRLSPEDEYADSQWRLSQVVDGWEIYEVPFDPYLRIALKAKTGMPIQGQHLKGEYFLFKGNRRFVLALTKVETIIQVFDPVKLNPD